MNYCYNAMETATDMTPSIPVERDTMRSVLVRTNELLDCAVAAADAILNSIRTPMPKEGKESQSVNCCMMDAALENRATAERLCDILKEIGLQLGVGM